MALDTEELPEVAGAPKSSDPVAGYAVRAFSGQAAAIPASHYGPYRTERPRSCQALWPSLPWIEKDQSEEDRRGPDDP